MAKTKIVLDNHDLDELRAWMSEDPNGANLAGQISHMLAGGRVLTEWDV